MSIFKRSFPVRFCWGERVRGGGGNIRFSHLLTLEVKKRSVLVTMHFIKDMCEFLPEASKYRKIPKISPGTYIFQRPFLRGLFLEGLIFGGAYLRREICVSKSIGLAL